MIGAEWIRSRLPSGWKTARIRDHVKVKNGYPFDSRFFSASDGMPLVRIRDIFSEFPEVFYTGDPIPEAVINTGDILVGMDGDFNVGTWRGGQALLNQRVCCLEPKETIDSRFLLYFLPTPLKLINEFTYSTTVKHLSSFDIQKIHFPYPTLEVQRKIATYLDRETTDIDTLIAAKQQLLDLLAEKRRAIATETIMGGLSPAAPLRASGVDWLGDIPAHWEALDLKWVVARISSGVSVNATDQSVVGSEPGVLKTSAAIGGRFLPEENKAVWEAEYERLTCPVKAESIIVSRMNTPALVAESGYVEVDYPNLFLPDRLWQIELDKSRAVPKFIAEVLSSHIVRSSLSEMATGTSASMKNLSQGDLLNFSIPLPPINEQHEIVRHITGETTKIDHLRAATEHSITLLKERRDALIAAIVTGEIDIPEAA
jgi:type I restriction enzyme S subunit